MNFIISPLVNVISKLTLIWRFLILTFLVGVALIFLVSNIMLAQLEQKRSTNLELQGMDLMLPSVSILGGLQSLRSAAARAQLTPGSVKKEQFDELLSAVDKSFEQLGDLARANTAVDMQRDYEKLHNAWLEVKAKQNDSAIDKFHLYDDYIDDVKDFLKTILARADLSLDNDVDVFYFVEMMGMHFPELIESFNMIKDLTEKALTKKLIDDDSLIYIGYALAIFEQSMNSIQSNIQYISNDEDTKALKNQTQDVINALNNIKIRAFLEGHILNKTLDADVTSFTDSVDHVVKEADLLFNNIAKTIMASLVERNKELRNQIIIRLSLCTFMLVFIALIFTAFYRSTKNSLEQAAEAAHEIANGNLLSEIPSDCKDDFKILFDAFIAMQGHLSEIVHDINDVSNTVNNSAREISSGNANLSERTQEQASALVETAASLNNLTDTVRKNADSARDATSLADKSSNIAEQGREAVGKVLITMGEINDSAQKIQEITSVIDSIAFQTNLLALNASVEAARAGEQGRGFAVVASEVRNLAQRSSDAAKQIKQLINDSMSKVEAGDKQVKLTADTMQEILQSITQVNDIVKLISIASTEQSNGIEQINIVVSGMEETTQKNAALVEEAAASAELLEKQSSKLVEVMNRFEA